MTKPRRRLDIRGDYEIPADNLYVARPDTTDRIVPNLIIEKGNKNYGLQGNGIWYNMHGQLVDYNNLGHNTSSISVEEAKRRAKVIGTKRKENRVRDAFNDYINRIQYKDGGSIHIAPSKRGTFTAAASKHNMGVQEFASRVLRNKENYSPGLVKKANFARNASKWH